jgi:hypothetical protein
MKCEGFVQCFLIELNAVHNFLFSIQYVTFVSNNTTVGCKSLIFLNYINKGIRMINCGSIFLLEHIST